MLKKSSDYLQLLSLITLLSITFLAGLLKITEASDQQCKQPVIDSCRWIDANQGTSMRIPECPRGYILTALNLFCSADCGDQDEDWVRSIQCCKISLE